MKASNRRSIVALGIALISGQVLAQPQRDGAQDMAAGMRKMNRDMADAPMTGDADRDFVVMMMPHHQGAIDMAQVELRDGKDKALRRLAAEIIAAQRKEIAMMKRWQVEHPAR